MIHIKLPGLPISSNHMYPSRGGGRRFLSDEGKAYKLLIAEHVNTNHMFDMKQFQKDRPYNIIVKLFLETETKKWLKKKSPRYKKTDTDNRLKVLLDVLSRTMGIDDSHFMLLIAQKIKSSEERTEVYVWSTDEDFSIQRALADAAV